MDLNWKVGRYPTFRVKRIHGLDLQAIGYLAQAGVITNTAELENNPREVLRLPGITDRLEWEAQRKDPRPGVQQQEEEKEDALSQ